MSAAHCATSYIHPFPDGNGRMARFLMNAILASGDIRVEGRITRRVMLLPLVGMACQRVGDLAGANLAHRLPQDLR
ncbi:MAG: Fic family protein [Xanthobacteraceae bacterium]